MAIPREKLYELVTLLNARKQALATGAPRAKLDEMPPELLILIESHLPYPSDTAHFIFACRRFANIFLDTLYGRNVQDWNSSALLWACQTGNIATVERCLEAGASVNHWFYGSPEEPNKDTHLWPPSQQKRIRRNATPGRPLSIAAQARQPEMVRFLLARGADPNGHDGRRAAHQAKIWYPLNWAVDCGSYTSGRFRERPNAPAAVDIVAVLLDHGANPNHPTMTSTRTRHLSDHWGSEPKYALFMALCEHVPAEVVRLLLKAGADATVGKDRFGCGQTSGRKWWERSPFYIYAPPYWNGMSEENGRKMILIAPRSGQPENWKLDSYTVPAMMARATPTRMELLWTMMLQTEPQVNASGAHALLDIWASRKKAALDVRGRAEDADQVEALRSAEEFIRRVFEVRRIAFAIPEERGGSHQVDLAMAFSDFCRLHSHDANIGEFVELLEEQGIHRVGERPTRQLTVSEAIQKKFEIFQRA